jgi:hypothetical protein
VVKESKDELELMLAAGEWLSTGQIGVLAGWSRSTAHRTLSTDASLRYRRSPGGQRKWNPDDIRRLLAATQTVHGGDA